MAGFDTSDIAAKVSPAQQNPFQMLGGLADLQNALNQNKMFQAKARAGQYIAQASDSNGKINFGQLNESLKNDAVTNPFIPDIMADAQNITGQGITNQTNQQSYRQHQITSLQSLLSQTTSDREVPSVVSRAVASGLIQPDVAQDALGGRIQGLDAQSISDLRNQAVIGQGNATSVKANLGDTEFINLGGKIQPVLTKVGPGGSSVNAVGGNADLTTTQTPATAGDLVSVIDPVTNTTHLVPRSSLETPTGQAGSAPAPVAALAPGQPEYQRSVAQNFAEQQNALQTANAGSAPRKAILQELQAAHTAFRAGPGSSGWSDAVAETNRLFGTNFSTATPPQQVFNKLTTAYAAQMRPALGLVPTDEQQQISQAANPNTNLSDEAIDQIVAQGLGNEDRFQNMTKAWSHIQDRIKSEKKTAPTAQDFGNFQTEFNSNFDPRYFQEKYMTPSQVQQMHRAMTPGELKRYNDGKARAAKTGFLQ